MARKKDAAEDQASKRILDQLNTKTVGPPSDATGLTGDQQPETVFKPSDMDLIRNQITLQLSNLEALNVLNTIGNITNTLGDSGPLVAGGSIQTATITSTGSSGRQAAVTGKAGQVLLVQGMNASCDTSPGTSITYGIFITQISTSTSFLISTISSSSTDVGLTSDEAFRTPLYIPEDFKLEISASTLGSASSIVLETYLLRTR